MPSRQSRRRKSLSNDDSLCTRVAELENRIRDLSKTVYDLTVELAGLTKDMVDNGPTSIKSRSSRSSRSSGI